MKEKRKNRVLTYVTAVGVCLLAVGLLTESKAVGDGIRDGLAVSAGVLIPSLFPFMVLSGFISLTQFGAIISKPLKWFTVRALKLPEEMGSVLLLSLIGGYPVGAKTIAGLLARQKLSQSAAERMLCFCVNAGPSFLITAVGMGMFVDKQAGLILFVTQVVASLLIGTAVSVRAKPENSTGGSGGNMSAAPAFVLAVGNAASGVIALCAFAVLFSGILSLVRHLGLVPLLAGILPFSEPVINAVVSGLLEVTAGCIAGAQVPGNVSFALVSLFVSFGGLSVIFQIMSCFRENPIRFRPFILSRFFHMALSTAMALPLYRKFCGSRPVWAASQPPHLIADGKTLWISVCLIAMCTILLLNVKWEKKRKRGRK